MVEMEIGAVRRAASYATGTHVVLPVFEAFQSARVEFAQEVAKLALPNTGSAANTGTPGGTYEVDGPAKVLAALEASYHLLDDMRPLVTDQSASVRENAMLAMGRLSGLSSKLSMQISEDDLLSAAIRTINMPPSPSLLKAALFLLHSVVRSAPSVAQLAVESNALPILCERLEDTDAGIKAAAVWCLAAIADHEASLAIAVVDCGSLALFMQCIKEPSLPLRRVTLACLGCIAKHNHSLADSLQKEGAIGVALGFLTHRDMLIRRQACRVLACAVQHHDGSVGWVPAESRAHLVETLRHADGETGAFAATLVQQLAKRSTSAATEMVELGVVPLLVAHIASGSASPAPAAAALGHICDASSEAAAIAINAGAVAAIKPVLAGMARPPICAVMCAALGAIGSAGEAQAAAIAASGAVQLMAESTLLSGRELGPAAHSLARSGISKALSRCTDYAVLIWLLEALSVSGFKMETQVLTALLQVIARLLSMKGHLRLDFMQRGALTLVQEAKASSSSELRDALKQLNATFPAQMVAATDPKYESSLVSMIS